MISKPMVCSVQTVQLSCTDTNIVSKRTKMRFHTTHVTYEFHLVRPKLFMSLWYVQCNPSPCLASRLALSPNGPNRAPTDPCHLGVQSGVSKMSYEPMVRMTQTNHLSCTDAITVSKHIKMIFHMTNVTKEFHRVPSILFSSIQYVQCKPCTNLASRHYIQTYRTELLLDSRHLGVPSSASKMIYMPMVCLVQTVHLSCTNTNIDSKQTKIRFHTTHVTYEFHRVRPNYCEPVVRSVQTMHLSCVKINTISKRTKQSST
jgi:hypothetical protein